MGVAALNPEGVFTLYRIDDHFEEHGALVFGAGDGRLAC